MAKFVTNTEENSKADRQTENRAGRKAMNKTQWTKLVTRLTFWLMAEVVLTCIGLDDWSDYSEYLKGQKVVHQINRIAVVINA